MAVVVEAAQATAEGQELPPGEHAKAVERQHQQEARRPLEQVAREYILDGEPAAVPAGVKLGFKHAYSRGYNRARKLGGTADDWQAAGKRAKRAAEGAWGQALARARRALQAERAIPTSAPTEKTE